MKGQPIWDVSDHHGGAFRMPSSSPYVPSVSQDPQNPSKNTNNAPKRAEHEPIDSCLLFEKSRTNHTGHSKELTRLQKGNVNYNSNSLCFIVLP